MRLTKHHGLGNDFLVVFTDQALPTVDPADLARRLCDRRRGLGADGLLLATPATGGDADVVMVLHNADGSRAEMSGNGIRCLVQAWTMRTGRAEGIVRVATDAGVRIVTVTPAAAERTITASVGMGTVTPMAEPAGWSELAVDPLRPVAHLSLGNPHSVVAVDDVDAVDLASLGALVPQVNLEIVEAGPGADAVTMRVHERGAGITEACGTGACATASAARSWGLVPHEIREITVHMAGGDARVRLDDPGPGEVVLTGPATFVATIEI